MSIIARTLDNERLSYEGSVYIRIPEGLEADDAVVVSKELKAETLKALKSVVQSGAEFGRDSNNRQMIRLTPEQWGSTVATLAKLTNTTNEKE